MITKSEYRVVRDEQTRLLAILEVYYNENGDMEGLCNTLTLHANSLGQLKKHFTEVLEALEKPVLDHAFSKCIP